MKIQAIYIKYNEAADEYVVRLKSNTIDAALCACPAEDEARCVAACINAVLAVGEVTFEKHGHIVSNGMDTTCESINVKADSLEQFHEASERCGEAFTRLQAMVEA